MKIQLSDHFNYKRLWLFTLPTIGMMIFTSIYSVVDGFFVSNFVGKIQFTALNFIYPVLMILGGFGFMFGTGGSALIAMTLGMGEKEKARKIFSMLVYVTIGLGIVLAIAGNIFIKPLAILLGGEGEMLRYSLQYGRIIMCALPFFMLQYEFQSFFVVAEKPNLGLLVTVISGVTNMVLDWLFMAVFKWGLIGAAVATSISQCVGGIIPIVYFALPNKSLLRLGKTVIDFKALFKSALNGSSELMTNIAMAIVGMLYNAQLLKYAGEDGIAAYGVLMYVSLVFLAIFIGYSSGIAPVVGYHYGAGNYDELKSLYKKSITIILVSSVVMVIMAEVLGKPLSIIFVGYDKGLMDMTIRAFFFYGFSFLFSGIAIFGSAFFTALNDGLVSALISFMRTLVFQIATVLVFPLIWGLDGIWGSIVAAEMMSVIVTFAFIFGKKKKYKYM